MSDPDFDLVRLEIHHRGARFVGRDEVDEDPARPAQAGLLRLPGG